MAFTSLADELAEASTEYGDASSLADEFANLGWEEAKEDKGTVKGRVLLDAPDHSGLPGTRGAPADKRSGETMNQAHETHTPSRPLPRHSATTPRRSMSGQPSPSHTLRSSTSSYHTAFASFHYDVHDQGLDNGSTRSGIDGLPSRRSSFAVYANDHIEGSGSPSPGHATSPSGAEQGDDALFDNMPDTARPPPSADSLFRASSPNSPFEGLEPSFGHSPGSVERDPLRELEQCAEASSRLTVALRRQEQSDANRNIENALQASIQRLYEIGRARDEQIRQLQTWHSQFETLHWGKDLNLEPLQPVSPYKQDGDEGGPADEDVFGGGWRSGMSKRNQRAWSEGQDDYGEFSTSSDILDTPTSSTLDANSGASGREDVIHIDAKGPGSSPGHGRSATSRELHALLQAEMLDPAPSDLRTLDETLSATLSHATHASRQTRGIRAAAQSAREAESADASARAGVEKWERDRMQRGLLGRGIETAGVTRGAAEQLEVACAGWTETIDRWGERMKEIREKMAPIPAAERHLSRPVAILA